MAAADFLRDVLEMFYASIPQEVQQRLGPPIRPSRRFEIERNNFNNWLRVWKRRVPGGNRDLLKFFKEQKIDSEHEDGSEHEASCKIFYESK